MKILIIELKSIYDIDTFRDTLKENIERQIQIHINLIQKNDSLKNIMRNINMSGVKIAILSKESKFIATSICKNIGISSYVERYFSVDGFKPSPHPEAFISAAMAMKGDFDKTLFVVNSLDDVSSVKNSGMSVLYCTDLETLGDMPITNFFNIRRK